MSNTTKLLIILILGLLVLVCMAGTTYGMDRHSTTGGLTRELTEMLNQDVSVDENTEEIVACPEPEYTTYDVPSNNSFKSYMGANCITSKGSEQYKLKSKYYLSSSGIYMVDGRFCVAVGSYYTTNIGTSIDLVMENGNIVGCILADCKADCDTDSTNRQNPNGSVVEFIVSPRYLVEKARKMGDCSWCYESMQGEITEIRVYK